MISTARTTDANLMRRIAKGDQRAFDTIWDRYQSLVRHLLRELSGSDQDDVMQDVAIAIWISAGRYNPKFGSVSTWLWGITRNTRVNLFRKNGLRRHVAISEDSASYEFNPIGPLIEQEQLAKAMGRVDPELGLQLRGTTSPGISTSLGTHRLAVKSRIWRSRMRLKAVMGS